MLASYQSALSAQKSSKIYFKPFFFARFGYLSRSFLLHNQHLSSSHGTPIPLAVGDTVLPFTATIQNFSSDVVNTSMATLKHWYHHRQLELVFYTHTEELASPVLPWSTLKQQFCCFKIHRTEDSTSLEALRLWAPRTSH